LWTSGAKAKHGGNFDDRIKVFLQITSMNRLVVGDPIPQEMNTLNILFYALPHGAGVARLWVADEGTRQFTPNCGRIRAQRLRGDWFGSVLSI
jgi:hypothetical protein